MLNAYSRSACTPDARWLWCDPVVARSALPVGRKYANGLSVCATQKFAKVGRRRASAWYRSLLARNGRLLEVITGLPAGSGIVHTNALRRRAVGIGVVTNRSILWKFRYVGGHVIRRPLRFRHANF